MIDKIALGLDVSKLTIDVCVLGLGGKPLKNKFANNPAGFSQLLSWLGDIDKQAVHACLEPTGIYSKQLASFLWHQKFKVSQVNSYAVQCHGRSKNFRSKTDRIDAFLLADFCLRQDPPAWNPPPAVHSDLKELQHRLVCLDEQIRQEENRLETVSLALVREDIEENLGRLYVRRKKLALAAKALVQSDEQLHRQFKNVKSIVGLGDKTTIRLLAMIQFNMFEDGRQVGAYAGLTPRDFESGTSVHKKARISRIGNAELRSALYFPAMCAIKNNPQFREFAERLKAKNKPPKVIICAVMRKLLVLAATLIRNDQLYDPNYRSPLAGRC